MPNYKELTINGVEILVWNKKLLDHTPQGCKEIQGTIIVWQVPDSYKILQAAGHDESKIDLAVPQAWWDTEYKKNGKGPKACWSYEGSNVFGEPLFWDSVIHKLETLICEQVIEQGLQSEPQTQGE